MWSLSTSKTFKRCQRQWYYKSCLSNARAKDFLRHKAYLLSKLQSISSWRGNVVDSIISEVIIPSLNSGYIPKLSVVQRKANELFERQLNFALRHPLHEPNFSPTKVGKDFAALHSIEYGKEVSDAEIAHAQSEVNQALVNLFENSEIFEKLLQAEYLIPQRALVFSHSGESVRAVPDLIAFYRNEAPLIVDWKVHFFGVYKAWKQLGIYALALKRCKPHRDFPNLLKWSEVDYQLWEIQLLTKQIRRYQLNEIKVLEIENFMAESIHTMQLVIGNSKKADLNSLELLPASSAEACQSCNYQSICWETA
ncbi:PD-(D/E)XK nuclease family protein [Nodosilinea sp. AN01ver1]|uniref:PD-(D/E)XK nuclease family protein n=1 Tax=Nodosilinea sp. AN01ver1 TaxID=3423362 RepID=UPI003D318AA4